MDHRQLEQIENYHAGRMSSEEAAAFEYKLSSDPALKAESDLQAQIINGLKDYRKVQLKSRMEAVDLTPSWIEFAQQSTLMKSFGGVAVATIVGAGVFFYGDRVENLNDSEIVTIDAPDFENPEIIWELGEEELPKFVENPTKQNVSSKQVSLVEEESKEEKPISDIPVEVAKTFAPSFDAPNAEDIKDEDALTISELDELPDEAVSEIKDQPIDVESETTNTIRIRYKYYDGKLFLSGDFDRAPYEILEINSANGRRIYVKYLDKYYKVGITDKLSDLPEVTDQNLIEELKVLRQNK